MGWFFEWPFGAGEGQEPTERGQKEVGSQHLKREGWELPRGTACSESRRK